MGQQFYELDVQTARSSGDDNITAMAERAKQLGFSGITVADYVATTDDVEDVRQEVSQAAAPLDVRVGAKLRPEDPGDLKDMLREIRDHVDVVVVHGGDVAINKTACGDTRVDVLAHPELRRKDSGLDHVAIKQAAENKVAIELNIRQLLETYGKVRSYILEHMRENVRLCDKFNTRMVTSSGATNKDQLRAPRELAAFPRILGMDLNNSLKTVADTPKAILRRADERNDESFVRPGVSRVDDAEQEEIDQ